MQFLNFPQDKIVWDVGHQSYTHKILTGRKEQFDTLRQLDGISGFQNDTKAILILLTQGTAQHHICGAWYGYGK